MEVRRETKHSKFLPVSKFYPSIHPSTSNSKMAQYIRTPFDGDFNGVDQVNQTVYHDERVITIDFDNNTNRVLVQNNGETFWLTSPDIDAITMRNVFEHLGIAGEQIVLTWPINLHINNVLDSPVQQAPLNQMSIYPRNQPIPAQHAAGPFPAVAGQPIPDAPNNPNVEPDFGPFQNAPPADDDDNQSELSDIPNYRILDHFGDSDDDRHIE
jgi:hypothetical protein